uniref:Uncharacterized protein n=1 Tax=Rhizophora mucronata TaxID=61149 RepID=A0A2P2R055_RHIMU
MKLSYVMHVLHINVFFLFFFFLLIVLLVDMHMCSQKFLVHLHVASKLYVCL